MTPVGSGCRQLPHRAVRPPRHPWAGTTWNAPAAWRLGTGAAGEVPCEGRRSTQAVRRKLRRECRRSCRAVADPVPTAPRPHDAADSSVSLGVLVVALPGTHVNVPVGTLVYRTAPRRGSACGVRVLRSLSWAA